MKFKTLNDEGKVIRNSPGVYIQQAIKLQTWSKFASASKQGLGTRSLTYSNGF